jgi:hypothetical protein
MSGQNLPDHSQICPVRGKRPGVFAGLADDGKYHFNLLTVESLLNKKGITAQCDAGLSLIKPGYNELQ